MYVLNQSLQYSKHIASDGQSMMNSPEDQESGEIKLETDINQPESPSNIDSGRFYSTFYNESVEEFFNLTYLDNRTKKSRKLQISSLQASKITSSSCYYCPTKNQIRRDELTELTLEETLGTGEPYENYINNSLNNEKQTSRGTLTQEFAQLQGSYWTAEEKEIFFNCLARYTIHKADEFEPYLPNKSPAEIYAYYTLLRKELKALKQNEFINDNSIESHVAVEVTYIGVRYSDLPIAYEIDEDTLEYEEDQSVELGNTEQVLFSKRASKRATIFNEYTMPKDSEDSSLLENEALQDLAKIYRGNQLFPCLSGRKSSRLYFNSYIFLEELIRYRTRELLGNIISKKAIVSNELLDGSDFSPSAQVSIYTQDVWKAVMDLKWFETSIGERSRYRDGKYPFLEAYWQNLIQSLDISVKDHQQVLDQSKLVLNSFKACNQTPSQLDYFLQSPSEEKLDFCDEGDVIEAGARGYDEEEITGDILQEDSQFERLNDNHFDKETNTASLQRNAPDDEDYTKANVATSQVDGTETPPTTSTTITATPTLGKGSIEQGHRSMKDNPSSSPESSRSLWLDRQIHAPKRSLSDCEGEDRLLQLEEVNLSLLDNIRDAEYLQSMRKKLKLDVDDSERSEENQMLREDMILENLNNTWNRSFAYY